MICKIYLDKGFFFKKNIPRGYASLDLKTGSTWFLTLLLRKLTKVIDAHFIY